MISRTLRTCTSLTARSSRLPTADLAPRAWSADPRPRCPSWGYPTEDAYYRDASSTDSVVAIRIPFLAVQAKDDPVSTSNFGLP